MEHGAEVRSAAIHAHACDDVRLGSEKILTTFFTDEAVGSRTRSAPSVTMSVTVRHTTPLSANSAPWRAQSQAARLTGRTAAFRQSRDTASVHPLGLRNRRKRIEDLAIQVQTECENRLFCLSGERVEHEIVAVAYGRLLPAPAWNPNRR